MQCKDLERLAVFYACDELSAEERQAVEQHAATCAACAASLAREQQLIAAVRARLADEPSAVLLAQCRGEPRPPGAASAVWDVAPETTMTPRQAFFSARETVGAEDAAGRVAAEMVAPYPPGIPAIAPGEVVSLELVDALREAAAGGTRLSYCADPTLATLQVVARP